MFLGKGFLKICNKFTGEHPCRGAISTLAWIFSCKFAAYFQNIFFQEHLWTAASEAFVGVTRCSIDTFKWLEYLVVVGKCFIRLTHIKIFETVQKSYDKIVSKEAPEYDY